MCTSLQTTLAFLKTKDGKMCAIAQTVLPISITLFGDVKTGIVDADVVN